MKNNVSLSLIKKNMFVDKSVVDIDKYLESILLEDEYIGKGVSTVCFEENGNEDEVMCFTVDFLKLLYLKKSKAPGFKFMEFIKHNDNVIYKYKMNKLEKMSDYVDNGDYEEFEILQSYDYSSESDEFIDICEKYVDLNVINNLAFKYKKYVTIYPDFLINQFGIDLETGDVYCFDPFISSNVKN